MDGALFYLEILSKESVAGPLNYSLGKRGYMLHRDPEPSDVAGRTDTEFRNWADKNLTPQEDLDHAFALINQQGNYPGVATFAYNRTRTLSTEPEHAYGTTRADLAEDSPKQYLDMDVIDTTWMDNNVHAIRHNYFNINPTIVRGCCGRMVLARVAGSGHSQRSLPRLAGGRPAAPDRAQEARQLSPRPPQDDLSRERVHLPRRALARQEQVDSASQRLAARCQRTDRRVFDRHPCRQHAGIFLNSL